jgi:uncharacterized protein (TIGR00251 family)
LYNPFFGEIVNTDIVVQKYHNAIVKSENGIIIQVHVKPRSKISEFCGFNQFRKKFELKVKSPPWGGRANEEVIIVSADFFGLKRNEIEIISGKKTAEKKILLKNAEIEMIVTQLEARFP